MQHLASANCKFTYKIDGKINDKYVKNWTKIFPKSIKMEPWGFRRRAVRQSSPGGGVNLAFPMMVELTGTIFGPKFVRKTTPKKDALFGHFGDFENFSISMFSNLESILGPSWVLCLVLFLGPVLHSCFCVFQKNTKKEKVGFVSENTVFREGHQFEKNTRRCKHIRRFVNQNLNGHRLTIHNKFEKHAICYTNR